MRVTCNTKRFVMTFGTGIGCVSAIQLPNLSKASEIQDMMTGA